jgi:hypothetical protein
MTTGRAAELTGMSRVEFLLGLGRYEVFPFGANCATWRAVMPVFSVSVLLPRPEAGPHRC